MQSLAGKNRGLVDVVCGAQFNLGLCEIPKMVNMWGIYTTSKEANMYPKPVQDLSGWNTRSIACNTKVSTRLKLFCILIHVIINNINIDNIVIDSINII